MPSNTIYNAHNNRVRADGMNVDAFVDGVLSHLLNVLTISFKGTLMNTSSLASVHTDTFEESLSYHIRRIERGDDHQYHDNIVNQLRRMSSVSTTGRPQSRASGTWVKM